MLIYCLPDFCSGEPEEKEGIFRESRKEVSDRVFWCSKRAAEMGIRISPMLGNRSAETLLF